MSKNKLFVFMAAMVAIVISVGFLNLGDNRDNVATQFNSSVKGPISIHSSGDAMVGAWTTGAPMTTMDYFGSGVGYTSGSTAYVFVIAGNAPSAASNVCQRYNVTANTWLTLATLPYTTVVNGTAVLKDSVYTFGGYLGGSTPTTNFYKFDINAGAWVARTPMPAAGAFCKGVGYQDSLIYVNQGYNGSTVTTTVWVYNSNTNSWRTCTPLPGARFGAAFSRSGDTLVLVGGADLSLFYNQTYKGVISQTDRSVITWTTGLVNPQLGAGMYRIDAHNWGCKGIIHTGGSNSASFGSVSNIVSVYSPGANTWTAQANKPTAWTCGQSGSVQLANNIWKLVCASGYNGTGTIAATEIFTDTISCAPPALPLCEEFTSTTFPPTGWSLVYTGTLYWSRVALSAFGLGSGSARYDMWNNPSSNQSLVTPDFTPTTTNFDRLYVDFAYAPYPTSQPYSQDSLIINTSTNGGSTWTNLVRMGPIQLQTVPAAGSEFIPVASSWVKRSWLLPNATNKIEFFAKSQFGNHLYLDSICINDSLVGITPIGIVAGEYSLGQNYPNPFNPSTTIAYNMPQAGNVQLIVFDILGREVATLVNGFMKAGTHDVVFDASNYSSGVYFYKLVAGDVTITKKMLLVK